MKLPRITCILFSALLAAAPVTHALALKNISPWAKSDVLAASSAGLMPDAFSSLQAKTAVSRAEFCSIALKLYEAERETTVKRTKKVYFKDCDDPDVNTAYEMQLISGRSKDIFAPEEPVSRQDLCVILDSVRKACAVDKPKTTVSVHDFPDGNEVRDYATHATETMLSAGIIKGVEVTSSDPEHENTTLLSPLGTATREQALIMSNRFFDEFDAEPLQEPEKKPDKKPDKESDNHSVQDSAQAEDTSSNNCVPMQLESVPVSGDVTEKRIQVFGETAQAYTTSAEAEVNIVEITIPVWTLLSSGQKTPASKKIKVNAAIADQIQDVFQEIFNGNEKFPIKDVGGYAWRSSEKSEHRQGTAIDINYMENMECTIDANGNILKITTGSHWTPWEDPYSIPPGGDVVRAFAKQGFAWGGDAWKGKRDYMHFSYFGT